MGGRAGGRYCYCLLVTMFTPDSPFEIKHVHRRRRIDRLLMVPHVYTFSKDKAKWGVFDEERDGVLSGTEGVL